MQIITFLIEISLLLDNIDFTPLQVNNDCQFHILLKLFILNF